MLLENLQKAAVLRKDGQLQVAWQQHPAVGRLCELNRAAHDALDFPQSSVPGVREGHAPRRKIVVRQEAQYSGKAQSDEFGVLTARIVTVKHMMENQEDLAFLPRDFEANFFACRSRISRQAAECVFDRRR